VVFPVVYNDKFYKDILDVGELAKLGELQWKLDTFGDPGNTSLKRYIIILSLWVCLPIYNCFSQEFFKRIYMQ